MHNLIGWILGLRFPGLIKCLFHLQTSACHAVEVSKKVLSYLRVARWCNLTILSWVELNHWIFTK